MESSEASLPVDFLNRYGLWAVITGASAGIGAEFAQQLAAAGLSLVLVARRVDRLEATALTLMERYPIQVKSIQADLSTEAGVRSVIYETEDLHVGLLVNNAGVAMNGSFFRTTEERNLAVTAVNVTAVTLLTHALGLRMGRNKRGGIIFVSSVVAGGVPWSATYSSAKTYVSTFASVVRYELQPRGVDVLCLEPGRVDTEMIEDAMVDLDMDKLGIPGMTPRLCVRETLQGLYDGREKITPGLWNKVTVGVLRSLPRWLLWFLINLASRLAAKTNYLEFPDE